MDDVWKAIAELAATMHRDRIRSVADAILRLKSADEFERARVAFGPSVDAALVERLHARWRATPLSPAEISAAFRGAAEAVSALESSRTVELVWTGPNTGLIPTRRTEQVILEVIDSAKADLFLVSYVFYKASSIVDALKRAVGRGVRVKILLESSADEGGAVKGDSAKALSEAVPDAAIYSWAASEGKRDGAALSASVHAKCVVADRKLAFVTSANLTSAALERNMELGLLICGDDVPYRLHAHLEALVTTKIIARRGE